MQFERLKKNHKKEILIALITICVIGGALTFNLTRAKYEVAEDLELAKGSINYKSYDFKIMAMYKSDDKTNYTEITDRMPSSGYIINETKSYCTLDNKNKDTNVKLYTNSNGEHIIKSIAKNDKCYLYFDAKPITMDDIIASTNYKTTAPTTFESGTTTDEGVYSISDGMYGGTSYYWRGLVTNNYVKFANKCWRIVRINGNGTMRLIYDGTSCHANGEDTTDSLAKTGIQYNTSYNNSSYVGWTYTTSSQRPNGAGTASNAKTQLESWYSANITGTNAEKVASGKYCNDRNVGSGTYSATGSAFFYAGNTRLNTNKAPILSCPNGDTYTLSVGLITADEVAYAGGVYNKTNTSYYLYNGQYYWTMSPRNWDGTFASMFCVTPSGYFYTQRVHGAHGLRPVINLRSDVTFSGGNGTIDNPYVVS